MHQTLYTPNQTKSNGSCPTCGFHISHSASFDGILAGQFDTSREGSYTATRITPVRASTFQSDVAVPAAQSLIWSVVCALPVIPVSYAMRYEWYFPLAISSVALLVSWISAMKRSGLSQSKVEEFSYYTSETESGKTEQRQSAGSISLDVTDRQAGQGVAIKIAHLPVGVSDSQFVSFCREIEGGQSLARKNWTGPGKEFSRDVYDSLLAEMERAGLVMSIPGKGRTLTVGGRHGIERMLAQGQTLT